MESQDPQVYMSKEKELLHLLREKMRVQLSKQGMAWATKQWTHSHYQKLSAIINTHFSHSQLLTDAEKNRIGNTISVSTLKRIFKTNYKIADARGPKSLTKLCVFLGFKNWDFFCKKIKELPEKQSQRKPPALQNVYVTKPPLSAATVIGRQETIQAIHKDFKNTNMVLLSGLSGIGKTVIAQYYVDQYAADYQHIAWFNFSDSIPKTMIANVSYQLIQLDFDTKYGEDFLFKEIIIALSNLAGNNLMIFDGVDDKDELEKHQQDLNMPNWKVLITSKTHSTYFNPLKIDLLQAEEAKTLFYTYYKRGKNDSKLAELLALIGGHTFVTELVAKIAQRYHYNIPYLVDTLQNEAVVEFSKHTQINTSYKKNLPRRPTSQLLLEMFDISSLSVEEQHLLLQFSVLPSTFIPYETLRDWLKISKSDERLFINHLTALFESGWLFYDDIHHNYKAHQLVQQAIQHKIKPTTENCKTLIDSLYGQIDRNSLSVIVQQKMQIDCMRSIVASIEEQNTTIQLLCEDIHFYYISYGDFGQALKYQLKAVEIGEALRPRQVEELADSYLRLAHVYYGMHEIEKALEFGEKSIQIRQALYPADHIGYGRSYRLMAMFYETISNFDESLDYHIKGIEVYQKVNDFDSLSLAYHNLSGTYMVLKQADKALEAQTKAIKIYHQHLEKDPLKLAILYSGLASVYNQKKEFYKALEYGHKSMVIQEEVLPPIHRNLCQTYHNLSGVHLQLDNTKAALKFATKATHIAEQILPPTHPALGSCYLNLAKVYAHQKARIETVTWAKKAIGVFEKSPDSPSAKVGLVSALGLVGGVG